MIFLKEGEKTLSLGNIATIAVACLISLAFSSWPIFGKYMKAPGIWVGILVSLGTTVTMVVLSLKPVATHGLPTTKIGLVFLGFGVLNGAAIYMYSLKIADPTVPTAVFVVMISVGMVVFGSLLGWIILGQVPTRDQIFGYGLAVIAIYFISK